jgi:hypothetical protein
MRCVVMITVAGGSLLPNREITRVLNFSRSLREVGFDLRPNASNTGQQLAALSEPVRHIAPRCFSGQAKTSPLPQPRAKSRGSLNLRADSSLHVIHQEANLEKTQSLYAGGTPRHQAWENSPNWLLCIAPPAKGSGSRGPTATAILTIFWSSMAAV